jgi:hypothetical protein
MASSLARLATLMTIAGSAAQAQSLIVGIPNAETTPTGKVAITHESQALVFKSPAAWNSFTFITFGLAEHLEGSVSLNGLSAPRAGELSLGVGFKWILPLFTEQAREWELRATIGSMALASLDRRELGGWAYTHASVRLPRVKTRLTAGVSYGSEILFGAGNTPVAVMAGIEQPITDWLWLVADWYSGNHALGAFIPAVQFNVWKFALIAGFKLDNRRENPSDALIFEAMFMF